ncbi:hypothetical protein FZ041_12565 [Selenomonas caprae]|uniref:Uncharacterized protein n=1 Tax=Selenomonas caprae TaxID=2606905 RepID=A0A5D6WHW0_9FIRM|nr:hypothetical protein [Selenomonas caprae]TYZ27052.1 hypothetical protein FZ041_12565 [Selenomonas caprae]
MNQLIIKLSCLLTALLFSTTTYVSAQQAPANYTVWDRMPAEAAVNVKLKVQNTVTLYTAPNNTKVIGTISSGEIVNRISCVVYTHPSRHAVKVLKTTKAYKYEHASTPEFITLYPGTIIYLLQYTGEGTYLALWNGHLLWWLEGYNISGFTNSNPNSPWGIYIGEVTDASLGIDFWMCLRTADGTVGWTHPKDYPSGTFSPYWK